MRLVPVMTILAMTLAGCGASVQGTENSLAQAGFQAVPANTPARQAALRGGLPDAVAAVTVNKVCGSGLKAVMFADQAIRAGDIGVAVAEQYPRLVLGVDDAAIFQRSLPWDHAAGALFLAQAGGVVRRLDGSPYRIGDPREVMIAAASAAMWERAVRVTKVDA